MNVSETRTIALTFDDAPLPPGAWLDGMARASRIVTALRDAGVPGAAFLVNSVGMDADGRERIRRYADAGYAIGNHTHTHIDINHVSADDFLADVRCAHEHLATFPGFAPWFRFPYLREGAAVATRDRVRDEIAALGYRNAYVTINTFDWRIDHVLRRATASGPQHVDLDAWRHAYLELQVSCVEFYDRLAQRALGRSPHHVVLLHENDVTALFIADLIVALRARGWKIIAPEAAYDDDVAEMVTRNVFRRNPGRIGEIAADCGLDEVWHPSSDRDYVIRFFEERRLLTTGCSPRAEAV